MLEASCADLLYPAQCSLPCADTCVYIMACGLYIGWCTPCATDGHHVRFKFCVYMCGLFQGRILFSLLSGSGTVLKPQQECVNFSCL